MSKPRTVAINRVGIPVFKPRKAKNGTRLRREMFGPCLNREDCYLSFEERLSLYLSSSKTCAYCGCKVSKAIRTIDHAIPLSRGGDNSPENLRVCCKTCNKAKGFLTVAEWSAKGYPGMNTQGENQ